MWHSSRNPTNRRSSYKSLETLELPLPMEAATTFSGRIEKTEKIQPAE